MNQHITTEEQEMLEKINQEPCGYYHDPKPIDNRTLAFMGACRIPCETRSEFLSNCDRLEAHLNEPERIARQLSQEVTDKLLERYCISK